MAELARKHCVPCSAKTPPVPPERQQELRREVPDWKLEDGKRLARDLTFRDFKGALAFANAVGELAEAEGHHPDLHLTEYKRLRVVLSTHAIGALSENDFVLAAKIDRLPGIPTRPAAA